MIPNMEDSSLSQLQNALRRISAALVRLLLRYNLPFDDFASMLKQQYVRIARTEFSLTRRPTSKSRIALLTGLNRREVARLIADDAGSAQLEPALGPVGRIVAAWVREPAFHTSDGRPSRLRQEGETLSLAALIRHCAADIPAKAVLRELLRLELVAELPDGRIELLAEAYLPKASEAEKLRLLGMDVAALIGTIDHNLKSPQDARFQRKLSFDHLSDAGVARLRELVATRGMELLVEFDSELAAYNQTSGGHFAGLGMYQFIEQAPGETHEDE